MRVLPDSRENGTVLMMYLVKTIEKRYFMKHSMEAHEDEIVHHHQDKEALYHLKGCGKVVKAHLRASKLQASVDVKWKDYKVVE